MASEQQAGLTDLAHYQRFADKVERNRQALLELLASLQTQSKAVAAYGAPAKGNTLPNDCGIGFDTLQFAVDKNALKVGRYTPGMHIPVLDVSALLEQQPEYVLILAWNFADEIVSQQSDYRGRQERFIIPIPEPKVI